ncbi:MAG TPA: nucleotidyltransferase domain-containing protein [Longimicrobiales bacterium]
MTDPRRLAEEFVAALKRELGGRMQSAALFGSAARDEWIEGVSDINVLVLVDDIDAPLLARAAPVARDGMTRAIMPLVMELAEWRRAADVFSIELADMRDAHGVLHGEDPVAHYAAALPNLRLQAERELRAKLLHLHSGLLLGADDRARLGNLLVRALPSFVTYLRAALRLAARPVPGTTPEVIDQGCGLVGADPDSFLRVHGARTQRESLELDLSDPLADAFNTSAERLAAYIDTHGR